MTQELKAVVGEYVEIIDKIGTAKVNPSVGEKRRQELHREIMRLTGLNAFEFGGLPAWYRIESVERATTRLYSALLEMVRAKSQEVSE